MKMRVPIRLGLIAYLSLVFILPAKANILELTLRDAVRLALAKNPGVISGRLTKLEAAETARVTRSDLLPKVDAVMGASLTRLNLATVIGSEDPTPHHAGPFAALSIGPAFQVPIFNLEAWR